MMDLLCRFAHRFPTLAAEILERDRHKRRNFREETITDVLMAGLVPFEPFGIRTDYPFDESATGEDMDWEFVNEHAVDGRRYIRLHIQAKRAKESKTKAPYWFYGELDHAVAPKPPTGSPKPPKGAPKPPALHGSQHKLLIDEAAKLAGCVPLYMFYHPMSATVAASGTKPAIEGLNWIFANDIPVNLTSGAWPVADKKIEKWRKHFRPLSDLLCLGHGAASTDVGTPDGDGTATADAGRLSIPTPGEIEDLLNEVRGYGVAQDRPPVRAIGDIPQATLGAIRADSAVAKFDGLKRPRAIFVSGTSAATDA
jgi:hypothetical protein